MRVTVEIPYDNVQRQNLQVGDGMLVVRSQEPLNRFQGKIVKIEMSKEEKTGGGGFSAE